MLQITIFVPYSVQYLPSNRPFFNALDFAKMFFTLMLSADESESMWILRFLTLWKRNSVLLDLSRVNICCCHGWRSGKKMSLAELEQVLFLGPVL